MKQFASIMLSAFCLASFTSVGSDSPEVNPFKNSLGQVPAAELPAAAAKMVKQAKTRDLSATTVSVVKAALDLNPAAAPAIVGAIARLVPEAAAVAAGCAAAEQPTQARAIARAAAAAAPAKAGKIAKAVCRAVPNDYRAVALAVTEAAPGSGREVLEGVASAIPELRAGIDNGLADWSGRIQSVGAVLEHAGENKAGSPRSIARGPAVGPPYIPYWGTAQTVTPDTSGEVQPGGRDYARP